MAVITLWLLILALAIAFGAGLYEHRIVLPQWFTRKPNGRVWNAQAAREADVGRKFWGFVSTGPLTLLLLLNAYMSWNLAAGPVRTAWLVALSIVLIERLLTFGYFIPVMVRLMKGDLTDVRASNLAHQWSGMNWFRHALNLLALLATLKAFALYYAAGL
jgi:hypothetical protein